MPSTNASQKCRWPGVDWLKHDALPHLPHDNLALVIGETAILGQADRLAPAVPKQLCSLSHSGSIYACIYTGKPCKKTGGLLSVLVTEALSSSPPNVPLLSCGRIQKPTSLRVAMS